MHSLRSFAVVPAAGESRRMGVPKLLLPHDGRTIIERVLESWTDSHVDHVVVIVRADDTRLANLCRSFNVHVVTAATPPAEMRVSIEIGLDCISDRWSPRPTDAWLVAPADLPLLSPQSINRVLASYRRDSPRVVLPVVNGRRGHPVLLPWSMVERVRGLASGEGLDSLIRSAAVEEVNCGDPGVLEDVDTPADYERLNSS
jgi:molybdenum cofactor cytidylyltransferase